MLLGAALGVLVLGGVVAILSGRSVLELPELLLQRIGQSVASHDMSNMTRLYAWTAAWRAFQEAPVLGIGWGGFGFHYYLLAPAGGAGAHFGWPMANNLPLLVLAETGLVGALLWGWAAWPALRALLRPAKPGSRIAPEWWWDWGFAALCAGVLVQTLTFSQWNLPHLWLLAGISAALGRRIRSEPEGLV